jgi:hypothetical protein
MSAAHGSKSLATPYPSSTPGSHRLLKEDIKQSQIHRLDL